MFLFTFTNVHSKKRELQIKIVKCIIYRVACGKCNLHKIQAIVQNKKNNTIVFNYFTAGK